MYNPAGVQDKLQRELLNGSEPVKLIKTMSVRQAWQGRLQCGQCPIRNSSLFRALNPEDLSYIRQPIEYGDLEANACLYRTGEPSRAIYTLRKGSVKLVQYLPEGVHRIVRLLKVSDTLGLEALVNRPYQHDAVTLQPTEVCVIPVKLVKYLSTKQPRLCNELMERWQQALDQADSWLTHFATGTARQRVARLLLYLAEHDSREPIQLFNREDIGAILGLTTETVSRVISEMRRQGVLDEITPHLVKCEYAVLLRIAGGELMSEGSAEDATPEH